MKISELDSLFSNHTQVKECASLIKKGEKKICLKGLTGSSKSLFITGILNQLSNTHLIILPDKEYAAYFQNDLELFIDQKALFFPTSYKRSILYGQEDSSNLLLRAETLNALANNEKIVIVTYPEAIAEKVIQKEALLKSTLNLSVGENISIDFIQEILQEYHFEYVDFVYEPGQYSIRGSIVDIFSYASDYPFRIDFFGDVVESIRSFEIDTQLSKNPFSKISIIPKIINPVSENNDLKQTESIFSFLPNDTILWADNILYTIDLIIDMNKKLSETGNEAAIINDAIFKTALTDFSLIEFGQSVSCKDPVLNFEISNQPLFNKNFTLLNQNILENSEKGYSTYILSDNEKQIERIESIFSEINPSVKFIPIIKTIHEGFIDHELKICFYTDHQIFGRYHKFRIKNSLSQKESINMRELNSLQPGDYVVHIDHGIGKFGGLEKIEISGKVQESIKLVYKDKDTLYVSIHSLHKISKYKGKDAEPPRIYKLGTAAWQKLKQTTKSKVKDIAKELIQLYAMRKAEKGFSFAGDTYLQRELESSFIYEDTPDQLTATKAVKDDMEKDIPMDRLICGDVGFGKTEIAIRAAFKAVTDSKQVAVLVPTTILALQHYGTFKSRLAEFPCTVDHLSRLRTKKSQTEIIKNLAEGKIDIIIGTHRLIGNEIKFKDLGLLIIDEEQKFGVSVKEKLKKTKLNIDTLTLTATPIPRTLQFSMMGARDLSIINTPPPNRFPIITELHTFNEAIIKEAIDFEFYRNGQVFFIHNRVQNILEIEKLINSLCPNVKTIVAHGQMEPAKLEKVMLDFINFDYDVLIATTIIESGLDIPNANTIIINNAQNFGLSDLHQLRGRVGRSNKKAFCYLLAPPLISVTQEARRRLKAIEEFSELGSGFNIAMQDLDIRGAGNLLGAEQSGFITDIGFETYHRILNEAILELKETDFYDLFKSEEDHKIEKQIKQQKFISDCQIDTDLELLLPESYINNISERIKLYRELDNIESENNLAEFENHLKDRFGTIPEQTIELMNIVRLRWMAVELGFEKIILKNSKMVIYFIGDQKSPYYKSQVFINILNVVQQNPKMISIKEANNKLSMTILKTDSVKKANEIIQKFRL
ncbi:MAG: transcription-repair coupling factor [Bacteroidetes bacterium GWC2_33_15]|nr:MAG: transcription-repair coupling factor [Bacteroidetes bacterium GWA2_33_15]OFX51270.1 MAG: transcription-repair coupling factor [Bacteroidetes bacterium GWC2_33_15]OFX64712.1 MAG: transcription-repair coupling factor [Bacteroidetes bacterium GWB2_32_14]OFX70673.1 MAG: transcription-repair coupling factor [Bacteroidetes bacterium GWD2_33_33]HAN20041.1 transcription-repair coupling factor [Bacteroidales bacterium]